MTFDPIFVLLAATLGAIGATIMWAEILCGAWPFYAGACLLGVIALAGLAGYF